MSRPAAPVVFWNAVDVMGTTNAVVMPLLVVCIAAFLLYYSRKSEANEWIS